MLCHAQLGKEFPRCRAVRNDNKCKIPKRNVNLCKELISTDKKCKVPKRNDNKCKTLKRNVNLCKTLKTRQGEVLKNAE